MNTPFSEEEIIEMRMIARDVLGLEGKKRRFAPTPESPVRMHGAKRSRDVVESPENDESKSLVSGFTQAERSSKQIIERDHAPVCEVHEIKKSQKQTEKKLGVNMPQHTSALAFVKKEMRSTKFQGTRTVMYEEPIAVFQVAILFGLIISLFFFLMLLERLVG